MTFYASTGQLQVALHTLLTRLGEQDPGATDAIVASRLVIRVRCTGPSAELTINARQRPVQTIFGPSKLRPSLDIELAADTLHRILLGEQSMKQALANGLLRVQGPVWKAMALAELFRRGQALYLQVLLEQDYISTRK
jgi:hypothetical protein